MKAINPVDSNIQEASDGNRSILANAGMKETGFRFLAILLVLINSLRLLIRKK